MDSQYERERQQNIAENERLLRELGIAGGGGAALGAAPRKRAPEGSGGPRRERRQKGAGGAPVLPQRASARLRRSEPEQKPVREPSPPAPAPAPRVRHEDLDLAALADLDEKERADLAAVLDVRAQPPPAPSQPLPPQSPLEEALAAMRLTSHARVAQKRIYAMAYHPALDRDLVFTGDQEGMLGVWDASAGDADGGVREGAAFQLRVHTKSIGALRLDPERPDRLYSSSYDGSVRVLALGAGTSHEVWAVRDGDDVQLGEFDVLAGASPALGRALWAADHRGGLVHIDERARRARRWQVCTKKIGGMSVWPREPHCIAAASNDRTVSLFDVRALRTLAETPVAPPKLADDDAGVAHTCAAARFGAHEYGMACTDASFSPDGAYLAALSYDDTVSVWRTADMCPPAGGALRDPLAGGGTSFAHNNKTGKWVTLFRAQWHPSRDVAPHFALASMERRAEIFAPDGRVLASLYDPEWVTAIPAVTAMHPLVPARLATGNGSGRCALWTPP